MLDSIEALGKYKVSLGTEDQFAHIMTFVKNMELKDSKLYEKNENALSRTFGDYLLKYFDHNLTATDINNLVELVNEYNTYIDGALADFAYKYRLYGISSDSDFNTSIINKISEAILSNLIKKCRDEGLNAIEGIDINKIYDYKLPLSYYIIKNILEIEVYFDEGDENESFNDSLNVILKEFDREDERYVTIVNNSTLRDKMQLASLTDFFNVYNKKDKIYIEVETVNKTETKYSASNTEIKYINAGELPVFFDLIIKGENDSHVGDSDVYTEYFIYYKEFNPEYRKLLEADTTDLLIQLNKNNKFSNYVKSFKYDNKNINIFKYFRNYSNEFLYAYDIYDTDKNITGTNKLFKYQYGNPYLARKAAENEIIKYYIADPYISDKYGLLEYQKFEIQNFLKIYSNVREYYYKVLLNESFINDEKYPFLEKFFLIFWSVERFLSSKIDNLKNIDSYDLTDIKNFLKSFGFKKLSDIIDENVFYNSEEYAAALVKNYKNLINYKGSKKVIDILEKIFSMDDTTLTIYKYLLIKENEGNDHNYKFVKTDYYSTNIYEDIISNISLGSSLVNHVKEDKYWDANNTKKEDLDNLNITVVNTKYLAPELSMNVAKNYIRSRCLLAIIEYIFDKFTGIMDTGLVITSSTLNAEFDYIEFLKIIKYLLKVYALQDDTSLEENYRIEHNSSNTTNTYKINETKLNTALSALYNNYTPKADRYKRYTKNTAVADMLESVITAFRSLSYISKLNNSQTQEKNEEIIKSLQTLYLGSNIETADGIEVIFKNIIDDFDVYFTLILNDFYLYQLSYEDYKLLFNDLFGIFFTEADNDCMCPYNDGNDYTYTEHSGDEHTCEELVISLNIDGSTAGEYITKLCNELSIAIDSTFSITTEASESSTLLFLEEVIKFFISYSAEIYKFQFSKDYNTKMENCIPRDTYKLDISYNLSDSMYYDEEVTVEELGGNNGNI